MENKLHIQIKKISTKGAFTGYKINTHTEYMKMIELKLKQNNSQLPKKGDMHYLYNRAGEHRWGENTGVQD